MEQVHRAAWADLDPVVAYELLRLRGDVFVVEQRCPYPELDGRDVEPATEHRWLGGGGGPGEVLAYLRVLHGGPAPRVGRVVTRPSARGRGFAARLLGGVLDDHGSTADLVLDAQSPLAGWYGRFGFTVVGAEFLEDGIPHLPMRRPAGG